MNEQHVRYLASFVEYTSFINVAVIALDLLNTIYSLKQMCVNSFFYV